MLLLSLISVTFYFYYESGFTVFAKYKFTFRNVSCVSHFIRHRSGRRTIYSSLFHQRRQQTQER